MYTPTVWKENMNTAAKLAALDNMENMYSEGINYLTALLHDSSYYTKPEADDKYFTSSNDGDGSGLICETLDGMTVGDMVEEVFPDGIIALWGGLVADIPAGWHICDGTNGTPDLRDRFLLSTGGGQPYSPGDTGGAATVTSTASITIAGHTLTEYEIPKHTHGTVLDRYADGAVETIDNVGSTPSVTNNITTENKNTGSTGGGQSHNHNAAWTGTSNQNKLPPYFALCYIMRV